jgi:hypothetical protein
VEVAHRTALPGFEPFVVAQQAVQVYYIPYPCKSKAYLTNSWVVYKVNPSGRLPTPTDQDYSYDPNNSSEVFFQEDGLPGTFEIYIGGGEDDTNHIPRDADEVVEEQDLELLNNIEVDSSDGEERMDVNEEPMLISDSDNEEPMQVDPLVDDDYF